MKKFLLTILILLIENAIVAQDSRLGIRAGLNFATVIDDDDAKLKGGIHIGGFLDFVFNEYFSLQPELLYSTQGAVYNQRSPWRTTLSLSYINVPVLLKIKLVENFRIEFGPQIGFLVSASLNSFGKSDNIKNDCQTIDVTALAGFSYLFDEKIIVEIRYGYGLQQIPKNVVVQLCMGYKF